MTVDLQTILEMTRGAEEIAQTQEGFRFCRFNKNEQKAYEHTDYFVKLFATAGVQMEFDTDADGLFISVCALPASRSYFTLEIFVDGKRIGCVKNFGNESDVIDPMTRFPLGEYQGEFPLGKGNKRIRIVFPWSVALILKNMELKNATHIRAVKKREKVLFAYGDSITQGYDTLHPSLMHTLRLADALHAELYNKALGGTVFYPPLAEAKSELYPDYILIAYGTNDWNLTDKFVFEKNAKEFISNLLIRYPKAKIYVLTPIWRKDYGDSRKFGAFEEVEKTLKQICTELSNEIRCICGWDFIPHEEQWFADGYLHPNDNGCSHYYENLLKNIR